MSRRTPLLQKHPVFGGVPTNLLADGHSSFTEESSLQPVPRLSKALAARNKLEVRRRGSRPTLLKVGANDGIDGDSVHPILAKHPIQSTLREPLLEPFSLLERSSEPGSIFRLCKSARAAHTEQEASIQHRRAYPRD